MKRNLAAIVELAKQIVAAAPALEKIESTDTTIATQLKTVQSLRDENLHLDQVVSDKKAEHLAVIEKTKLSAKAILDEAESKAKAILSNAQSEAANMAVAARNTLNDAMAAIEKKKKELADVKAEHAAAKASLDDINSIIDRYRTK